MRVNLVLVAVKLFVVLFVIVAGLFYINADNYHRSCRRAPTRSASTASPSP